MKTFDIKRFAQLCKWSAYTYRKEYLTTIMMMTVMYFIVLAAKTTMYVSYDEQYILCTEFAVKGCITIMSIILLVSGGYIFNNMKTKQQRLMYKLMPASNLEKFLARYIYVTLFWAVGCVMAFCIADVLRTLLSLATGHGVNIMATPYFFKALVNNLSEINLSDKHFILSTEIYVLTHSIYLLGGTFFRRRQIVLTAITLILVIILLSWTVSLFITEVDIEYMFNAKKHNDISYIIMSILPIFIVTNYWLSFYIFKKMQVINNKWINI